MARIQTYTNDTSITGDERVIGTDVGGDTINIPLGDLQTFILQEGVYTNAVPQERYVLVGADGSPTQGLLYETSVAESNVAIPANLVFFLGRDGDNFFVELRRFGQVATVFPYDINSFIGATWVSDDYATAGAQTITGFLDPAITTTSTSTNQTWRFAVTITTPLTSDLDSAFTGRALTNVVMSSLDRRSLTVSGDLDVLGSGGGTGGGGSQFATQQALEDFITNKPDFRTDIGAGTSNFSGSYADLSNIPTTFAPAAHTHIIGDITGLQNTLNGKADNTDVFSGSYTDLSNVPTIFVPAAHTHIIGNITGLQSALDGKADDADVFSGSYTDLSNIPTEFVPAAHDHTSAQITNFGSAVNTAIGISSTGNQQQFLAADGSFRAVSITGVTPDLSGVTTNDVDEGTGSSANLYYTEARVSANTDVAANTMKVGITTDQASAITANTAKTGITTQQASDITTNNAKTGISTTQASAITANTAKVGITPTQASAITANTAKVGITTQQASDITTNNAKVGISTTQASAITANTTKVGITTTQASAITANTAKVGITTGQASAITANTTKVTFPGFGTTNGQVENWAEVGNSTLIPVGKFPNIVIGDVHTYASTTTRNAATNVVWHQGDVAIISGASPVTYLYIGTNQTAAGVTMDSDWTLISSSSSGISQAAADTRYAAIADAFGGFGSASGEVAEWAEGADTSAIPTNKLGNVIGTSVNTVAVTNSVASTNTLPNWLFTSFTATTFNAQAAGGALNTFITTGETFTVTNGTTVLTATATSATSGSINGTYTTTPTTAPSGRGAVISQAGTPVVTANVDSPISVDNGGVLIQYDADTVSGIDGPGLTVESTGASISDFAHLDLYDNNSSATSHVGFLSMSVPVAGAKTLIGSLAGRDLNGVQDVILSLATNGSIRNSIRLTDNQVTLGSGVSDLTVATGGISGGLVALSGTSATTAPTGTGTIQFWCGTTAEYATLVSNGATDPDTIYIQTASS